jgi:hypothetical protein
MVACIPCRSAISLAFSARYSGVAVFEGSLARFRARRADSASLAPVSAPPATSSSLSWTSVKVSSSRLSALVL